AYEYSIMARDYALIMPLMFGLIMAVVAKTRNYWLIAALIFLNMQVEVYATLLTPFFMLVLAKDWFAETRKGRIGISICALSTVLGLAAAVASLYPPKHDLVTTSMSGQVSLLYAVESAILAPGKEYFTLLNGHEHLYASSLLNFSAATLGFFASIILTVLLYGACLALAKDFALLGSAVLGLWITTAFALLIYPMYYRHAGVWLIFLVCLFWVYNKTNNKEERVDAVSRGITKFSHGCLAFIFILNLSFGIPTIIGYTRLPSSDSRALARRIIAEPALHNAIILPEPGDMGESLAYYVPNRIYLVREHKFSKVEDWDKTTTAHLKFSAVMSAARALERTQKAPVIIVLQNALAPGDHIVCVGFNRSIWSTQADYADFAASTTPLPLGRASDEVYGAYLLRPQPAASPTADVASTLPSNNGHGDNQGRPDAIEKAAALKCDRHPKAVG
ncbi:MAG: hypothetical protein ACYDD1_19825, partial [Caulobacteraceae bacterium]